MPTLPAHGFFPLAQLDALAQALHRPMGRAPQAPVTDLWMALDPSLQPLVGAAGTPWEDWLCVTCEHGPRWLSVHGELRDDPPTQAPDCLDTVGQAASRSPAQWAERFWDTQGFGLAFTCNGHPTFDDTQLRETMWNFGCHPTLGEGIARDLRRQGYRHTTVMTALRKWLPEIEEELANMGVSVRRVLPWPGRGVAPADLPCPAPPQNPAILSSRPRRLG